MAGKRAVSPAMLAHLRAIASSGGKSTASKYGGWHSPHAKRKGTHKATTSQKTIAAEARRGSQPKGVRVTPLKPKNTVSTTRSRTSGLPKSGFKSLKSTATRATTKARTTTISRSR